MIFRLVSLIFKRTSALLFLSFVSLVIGGFLFGAVLTLTSSVTNYLAREARTLIGGDIIFSSPYPIDTRTDPFLSLRANGHTLAEARSFQGVFSSESGSTSPAAIRAVSHKFPLYGEVLLKDGEVFRYEPGLLYAEESFLNKLSVTKGDTLTFAGKSFVVGGVLLKEPDTISVGVSFAPKVIVFLDDIEMITLPLSESRTRYRLYIRENELVPIPQNERAVLKEYAREKRLRYDDSQDGPNNLLEGFSSLDDFIGIVLSVALFLVVINIFANLVYLLSRFRKTIALLKIYGATSKTIQKVFLTLFGAIGLVAGALGSTFGVYVADRILRAVSEIYIITLFAESGVMTVLLGAIFGLLFIIFAALPFLYLVKKVEGKELLLNQVSTKKTMSKGQLFLYTPIPLFVGGTLFVVSKNIIVSVGGVVICALLFVLFMGITFLILRYVYRLRSRFSFIVRSVVSFLYLRKLETLVSVAAIMTAFSLVFLVTAVQHNLEINLQRNISATAPSMYLVDISKSQLEEVRAIAGPTFKEYPIVRGRLLAVNNRDLLAEDNPELRREFNLTYRDTLIDGETLTKGTLGDSLDGRAKVPVSVDQSFAEELGGVTIGDTIQIFIQGVELTATITSVREVDSTSGIPFFYLVFPTNILSTFPATFFGTVTVGDAERNSIERVVASKFPNIIPIVTSSIVSAVTKLVSDVVTVIAFISIPSIVLGLLLIIVMLSQNMYERRGDVLVLRAFGLSRGRVARLFLIEGVFIVALAGILSYLIAHAIAFGLNIFLFSFTTFGFVFTPMYMILGNILLVAIISQLLSFTITRVSLKQLLAEK